MSNIKRPTYKTNGTPPQYKESFVLELDSDEYDTVYFALVARMDQFVTTLSTNTDPLGNQLSQEDRMFITQHLAKVNRLAFEMEQHNRENGDTRW